MKIKLDDSIKKIIPAKGDQSNSTSKINKKGKKDFEGFLEEAKAAGHSFEVGEIKQYTEAIQHLLKGGEQTELQTLKKNAIHSLERLFATLDMYRNALSNTKIDFSRMHAIIEDMNKEKDEMLVKMLELPEGDNLRDIMTGAAVLILNETNKYYRHYMY
ncbi:MAG: hypothetical protein HY578_01780 [Nitrospinae bacterium]|nr:hypothetical protein [Nitrospinota bacterium]